MIRPVLLVRPDGNEGDAAALASVGISTTIDSYLVVRPVTDPSPALQLADELDTAGDGDWLVLTSPRTLPMWGDLTGTGTLAAAIAAARSRGMRVAAVGPATASGLDDVPDLVGTSGGEELATALASRPRGRVLLPHSRIARRELADTLAAAGWTIGEAAVYDTVTVDEPPTSARGLAAGNFSAVVLRSPSAVAAVAHWATVPAGAVAIAIGPSTAAAARAQGWDVVELPVVADADFASLVAAALRPASPARRSATTESSADGGPLPADHPMRTGLTTDSPLVSAYLGHRTGRRPIWFMRQAGRSLPEYRAIRAGRSMLDCCLDSELAAEITVQPVRRHDVDAAIFFSDIVVPVRLAGVAVDIVPGTGPVVERPIRTPADVRALPELDPDAVAGVAAAVRLAVAELGSTPLIGFAGAPFTVASYLVEGRPSRELPRTRALMREDPQTWHRLLAWVARTTTIFLRAQGLAGASALQLFDSWAGRLSPAEYERFSVAHSAAVLAGVADLGLPRVHFGTGTRELLVTMRDAGADVMGVDWETPLDEANALLGGRTPLQGNIDPARLAGPWPELAAHATDVVRRGRAAPGHVVNLGHGVPPDTQPDVLTRLVSHVHELPEQDHA